MDSDSTTVQLVDSLRAEIGALRPGDQLPSTRRLVATHRVSPVTVSRALTALVAEGLIVTRPGAGTFVAQPSPSRAPADHSWQTVVLADRSIDAEALSPLFDPPGGEGVISLATGYPHASLMPVRALGAALARAARLPDAWERPPNSGLDGLRSWFAQHSGPDVDARDVLITPGGQGAITAAFRAVVPLGAPLLVESPTYPGALAVARAAGIRPVPVPVDAEGVLPDLLAEAFARTGAQAFYCQPTYQNPTGAVLSAERRAAVLAAAASAGAFVIEDDYARWLSHGPRPPAPLLNHDSEGRVIYITSLSKVACPSLRIGALISRGPVANRLRDIRVVDDMFVSRPLQEAALELVSRPAWATHLREYAAALDRRSRALSAAIATHAPALHLPPRPQGGMHLWAQLPAGLDDVETAMAARRAGVIVLPGRSFYPAESPAAHLRLTFSAAPFEADLEVAVRRLAAGVPELTQS
jgi:DNA-binding transcriptional MocR family regulator